MQKIRFDIGPRLGEFLNANLLQSETMVPILPSPPTHALSIRQPWAGLIAAGRKTIEVRTWTTQRRGWVYIHASKTIDTRRAAWQWVTASHASLCEPRGGLIAIVNFVNCISYRTPAEFASDITQHLNDVAWFQPNGLYGFQFTNVRVIPFRACGGQTFFFRVPQELATGSST